MIENPGDLERVRLVLHRHREDLLALPHVVGIGIGRPSADGPYTITVMTDRPVTSELLTLDGVDVVWKYTGPFQLHEKYSS